MDMPDRIYAERDEETNEKRWYSSAGMGVEYVRADLVEKYRNAWLDAISKQAAQEVVGGYDNAPTDPHHGGKIWNADRCIDGRLYRHQPFPTDPHFEKEIGECPECQGRGWQSPQDILLAHGWTFKAEGTLWERPKDRPLSDICDDEWDALDLLQREVGHDYIPHPDEHR